MTPESDNLSLQSKRCATMCTDEYTLEEVEMAFDLKPSDTQVNVFALDEEN